MNAPLTFVGRKSKYYRDHYYPRETNHAFETLHDALQSVKRSQDDKTKILLSPSGSYRICGKIMAAAYSQLCPEKIKRIFIFGRQTNFMPYKCGLSNFDHLETPLGRIMVDRNVNQKLLKSDDFRLLESNNDHKEQFIEMQLPFIAKIMEK
ncbi:unnamed protein product [Trichobilharzia szidati]|nr:unnamed protein product [Trichobilharzia szidati]